VLHQSDFNYYLIPRLMRIGAVRGFFLDRSCKILDFGCGSGAEVYAWRDDGFDAYGYDMQNYLKLRDPSDSQYFEVGGDCDGTPTAKFDMRIETDFRLPYEENTFDLVFSSQVLEHVMDHGTVFRELARVMKQKSLGIHSYPSKYRLVEPHINVPLAGFFHPHWWFSLWAQLGVKNQFQTELTSSAVAHSNRDYCRVGLNYKSADDMLRIAGSYFTYTCYMPEYWEFGADKYERLRRSRIYSCFYINCTYSILITDKAA
jgi:SAM-dependent methyltransferase